MEIIEHPIIGYLLKVSACTIGFYGLYFFGFRKFTFFGWNRGYLMASLLLSFLIPQITFHETVVLPKPAQVIDNQGFSNLIVNENPINYSIQNTPISTESTPFDWELLALIIYGLGASFFLIKLAKNLFWIYKMYRKSVRFGQYRIVENGSENASFFNLFLLNIGGLKQAEKEQIIAHEAIHAKLLHSLDMLLMEFCKVVLWFNPVVYFYKKSLSQIHEYEVDAMMVQQFDSKNYAHLLLKLGTNSPNSLTNQFSTQPLKERIQFLFTKPTNIMKKLFYVFVLPLIGISIFAFAQKVEEVVYENFSKKNAIKSIQIEDKTIGNIAIIPKDTNSVIDWRVPDTMSDLINNGWKMFLKDNELFLREKREIKGKIFERITVNKPINFGRDGQGFSVSCTVPEGEKVLFLIDNEVVSEEYAEEFANQNMRQVIQMNAMDENFNLVERLGERARGYKNAICIWTERIVRKQETENIKPIIPEKRFMDGKWVKSSIFTEKIEVDSIRTTIQAHRLGKNPLVIINGKEYPSNVLYRLKPSLHAGWLTLPNSEAAIKKYGEKARDGVYKIETKSDDYFITSETEYEIANENVKRELNALNNSKGRIVRIQLLNDDKTVYEKVIVRRVDGREHGSLEVGVGQKVLFQMNGKEATEEEVNQSKDMFGWISINSQIANKEYGGEIRLAITKPDK